MRSQKLFAVWSLAAMMALTGLFVGCSDDDAPTGNIGSLTDPEFVMIREAIESVVDSTVAFVGTSLSTEGRIPADDSTIVGVFYGPNPPIDISIEANYEYLNGWHILSLLSTSASFEATHMDSVRFLDAEGNPMELVVAPVSMNFRRHWAYTPTDTDVTHVRFVGDAAMDLDDINTNLGTLNGENALEIHSKLVTVDSTVLWDITVDAALTDIEFDVSPIAQLSGCPRSGSVTSTIEMVRTKDGESPVTTTWTVVAGFDDGAVNVVVTKGNTTWTYSADLCQ